MRCDQITEYLSAYIENDLEPGLRLNVDQHIEECAQCREDLAALNEVFSTLATQQMDREPPSANPETGMQTSPQQ
jgi:predicted anti-sigma-YlaC factor YlaD